MIGTVQVKVQAATPNLPLQPLFAFKGSPSSLRIMDVPKSIGQWNINEVSVSIKYPDNSSDEKQAVRTGNVWVATVEGCEVTGRVVKGYEVLANGVDEDGNPVVGYVLGSGDVFVLERDSSIPEKDVEKFYVKFCETLPAKPQKGDIVDDSGTVKMYDGTKWIDMGGADIGDATITIQKNGTSVGSFTTNQLYNSSINIPVPSTTNDLVNDSGFITSAAIPSTVSSFENDAGYITASALPTKVSELENDSGYITESAIPSNVGAFQNDVGYLTTSSQAFIDKRDYDDLTYPGSVYPSQTYRIREFNLGIQGHNPSRYTLNKFDSDNDSRWKDDEEYWNYAVTTSNGENFAFMKYGGSEPVTTFTMEQVQAGAVAFTMVESQDEYSCTLSASMYETTLALKDYVDAAIPSNVSELNNDVGYVTASAIPSNVSEFNNDVGYITASAISGKRDYTDLTFNTPSSAGRKPYTNYLDNLRWARAYIQKFNLTYDGTAHTLSDFIIHPEYGMMWYKASSYFMTTNDGTNFKLRDNDTNVMLQTTISLLKSGDVNFTYDGKSGSISLVSNEKVNFALDYQTMNGNLYVTSDNSTIGTYDPTNVLNTYIDLSSKRDKTDMDAVVGTTYASWNLSALHSTTYSPALELKWGTYNVFGEEQECWLVDDEYRQVCFFLLPELNMLYWGVRNQDNSYIAGYGETITISSDELSIATINGVAEITCTRTSKEGSPEVSTIATMKDLRGFQNINEKRDWWDNTTPASVDATGKFTINTFSVMVGSSSYVLDQFSKSGSTSTWKTTSGDYPNITTTDGLNFTLNYDSSTTAYFTMEELKPGPAKGTIGGSNFNVYANFMLTTFALKDYVDANCTTYSYVDANLNVSGIGCSTVTMSGIYSDLTSFSYNVVVQ